MNVYICSIDEFRDFSDLNRIWEERRQKVNRYLREEDRLRCLVGGLMMSQILGISDESQMIFNSNQKPYLKNSKLYFNLSHSGNYVAMAASDTEIGIDIEQILPYSKEIAQKCFVPKERKWLEEQKNDASFYKLWTAKESIMKAAGKGLEMAPESFCVLPMNQSFHCVNHQIWHLFWDVYNQHQICVASEKNEPIRFIHLSRSELLNQKKEKRIC